MEYKVGDKVRILGKTGTLVGINDLSCSGMHWKYIMELEADKEIGWQYKNYKKCYGTNYASHIKLLNKPKVYAWDTSAKREQKKLEQEQRDIAEIQEFLQNIPQIFIGKRQDGKSITHLNELIDKLCLCARYGIVFDSKINWNKIKVLKG